MHAPLSLPPPCSTLLPLPETEACQWVVCLCADWCGVCRDYRAVFEQVCRVAASGGSTTRFAWVDVEDHADLVGDLDVQTFPTVLIANASGVQFLGPVTPQANVLLRLLESMDGTADAHAAAAAMPGAADCVPLLKVLPVRAELWIQPG